MPLVRMAPAAAIALRTRIESFGGEGLVLRRGGSLFKPGRSQDLLKAKSWSDSEARVLCAHNGKGSVWVATVENGTPFK